VFFLPAFIFGVVVAGPADPITVGHIVDLGIDAQSFQQPEYFRIFGFAAMAVIGTSNFMNCVLRVVQVTEGDGSGRAGLSAGGLILILCHFPSSLNIGLFFGQLVTMDAKAALFDNTAHANRDIGIQ